MTRRPCETELAALSEVLENATLEAGSLNDALVLLRLYARLHWDNISGHFSAEALERDVYERWKQDVPATSQAPLAPVDFLHIATQTHAHGGHSRLLWRLSEGLSGEGTQALLLTDPRKHNFVPEFPGSVLSLKARPADRVAAIVTAAREARMVLLHIHPDDAAAAFAARVLRDQGKRVIFVNHADHVFTLGMGAADLVLEICMTGWKTTRDYRAAVTQSFMGIPIIGGALPQVTELPPRSGPIVSMGGPGKYCPAPGLSFPDFLMRLLSRVPNDVILIGPSEKESWWENVTAAYPGRVHLRGMLPGEEVEQILKTASCYVDSFPLDGGTAYPQAAAAGLPCFGPNAADAPGVAPTDALRFENVAALEEALVSYLHGGTYELNLDLARSRIAEDFSNAAVVDRVRSALAGMPVAPLDYLVPLGRRDSLYNARNWAEQNRLAVPKRLWRDLSLRARRALYRRMKRGNLPVRTRRKITLELIARWV